MKVISNNKTLVQSNNPCTRTFRTPYCRRVVKMAASTTTRWSYMAMAGTTADRSGTAAEVQVGKRWEEYQGIQNWEGLLDPLDETLRQEILRYGGFVEAAYDSFNPPVAADRSLRRRLRRLTGYRLSTHLRATSGLSLPKWAPPGLSRSARVGFSAVCRDRREIARLGRRDAVVALRGTLTALEWLENLRAGLSPVGPDNTPGGPAVESGFRSLYTSGEPSFRDMVREEVARLLRSYGATEPPLSLTFTGHSLGAALATLAAYDVKTHFGVKAPPLVTVVSFGGPRVGNRSFRSALERHGVRVLRIVNSDDLVTKVPGFVIDNNNNNGRDRHVDRPSKSHVAGLDLRKWIRKKVEDTPWVYAEVGKELRLSSRDSPSYLPWNGFDFATCHDLATYLHLVENFVSSTCPLRATARKLLRKTAAVANS